MFLFQRSIEISCFKLVIFDFMAVCHSFEGADTANTMSMSMSMSATTECVPSVVFAVKEARCFHHTIALK